MNEHYQAVTLRGGMQLDDLRERIYVSRDVETGLAENAKLRHAEIEDEDEIEDKGRKDHNIFYQSFTSHPYLSLKDWTKLT